jgi:hypothetical protein
MSSLQISSSQVINSIPSYHVQMSIKTFISICLIMVILILSFIFCLIFVYKFSQKNKKLKTDKIIKEKKNNLIEEELKNIKLIINLLQDEFHNKYTEMENKNNIISEEILRIKDKEIETQLQERDKNNLLVNEIKNLRDEINVLTHKFNYHNSTQGDNLNLLTEDLRQINRKVVQQQQINQEKNNLLSNEIKNLKNEINVHLTDFIDKIIDKIKSTNLKQNEKINLLEENIKNISNKVVHQKQIIENNKNQCIRFNSFLDNYSIKCSNNRYTYSIKLNGSISIPLKIIESGIEISFLRTLYSIGNYINFIEYHENWNKLNLSEYLNSLIINNNSTIEISIIDYGNYSQINPLNKYHSQRIPLFMLCLLFGTKIITFDGEDVTDLFEDNFNRIKRYHNSRELLNPESKRLSDMCNIDIVREMFK